MTLLFRACPKHPSIHLIYDSVDDDYRLLLEDVKNRSTLSSGSQALKGSLDNLSVSDDHVLLDSRHIVLPLPAVEPILKLLHSSHSGVTKTTNPARGLYFWPRITNDIKQLVSTCPDCDLLYFHSGPTPLLSFLHVMLSSFSCLLSCYLRYQ